MTQQQMFSKGQIVKGNIMGVFIVVGFKTVAGEPMIVVKEVNPANHSQVGRGQLCLPASKLVAL
jgi:hypothetical protein